jgi:hypothetical protein
LNLVTENAKNRLYSIIFLPSPPAPLPPGEG